MLTLKKHWLVFVITAFIILSDQLSKYIIVESGLFYTLNSGIAFSIPLGNMIAFIMGILIISFLFLYGDKLITVDNSLAATSLGLVIGGAMGNLIDRIRLDAVIDFIKVPYWPAFNVADGAIVVGIGFLFVILLKRNPQAPLSGG